MTTLLDRLPVRLLVWTTEGKQPREGNTLNIITIYHRTSAGWEEFSDGDTLETAYAYVADEWEDADSVDPTAFLGGVFRNNNAVDGTEINVQKSKRSLSVGDVVGLPDSTYWTVLRFGWGPVDEITVGLAITKHAYEEDGGLCPRCESKSLVVPVTHNALSRTCREPSDTPVYVCSECGEEEAWQDFGGGAAPQDQWPVADGGYESPFRLSEEEMLEMEDQS
jgi:DNA-directed RNA polymerase subunit RPC12/RpoP